MNKIDKIWCKSLRFLSRQTTKQANKLKKDNIQEYRKYVREDTENTLHQFGYIQFNENVTQVVTQAGLQQLRDLEEINRKDLTITISLFALFISFIALAKSFRWLK